MIRQAQAARACTFLKKSGPMPTNAILRLTESGLMPTKTFLMLTASQFPRDSTGRPKRVTKMPGRCKSRGKTTLVQGAKSTLVGVGKSPLVGLTVGLSRTRGISGREPGGRSTQAELNFDWISGVEDKPRCAMLREDGRRRKQQSRHRTCGWESRAPLWRARHFLPAPLFIVISDGRASTVFCFPGVLRLRWRRLFVSK